MWFDLEFLSSELEFSSDLKGPNSQNYNNSIEASLRCRELGAHDVQPFRSYRNEEFSRENITAPIVCSTLLQLKRSRRRQPDLITLEFEKLCCLAENSASIISRRVSFFSADDVDNFLQYYHTSGRNIPLGSKLDELVRKVSYAEGLNPGIDAILQVEKALYSEQNVPASSPLPSPVLCEGEVFQTRGKSSQIPFEKVLDLVEERYISPPFSSIERMLATKVRTRFTFELGLWCQGSKEMLRKSRCRREQLLQHNVLISPVLFALVSSQKRSFPMLQLPDIFGCVEETFDALKSMGRTKRMVSRRWLKFARAVRQEVDEDSRLDLETHLKLIREKINTYDPPRRRLLVTCTELIRSVYECTQRDTFQAQHSMSRTEEDNIPEESEESALEMNLYEFVNPHLALGVLVELDNENKCRKRLPSKIQTATAHQPAMRIAPQPNGETHKEDRGQEDVNRKKKMQLRAPGDLVCPGWSLKLAARCLFDLRRGIVFLPPPLSALPTIAVIVYSYLSESHADNRVIIICHGSAETKAKVCSYLKFTFAGQYSIDSIRRMDFEEFPRVAPLTKSIARVVILDSFEFSSSSDFSVLLVLGPGTASIFNVGMQNAEQDDFSAPPLSHWALTPSVLIFPQHPFGSIRRYGAHCVELSQGLNVQEALFVDEQDDVEHCLLLSRPDFLFLVPTREVSELLVVLETHASSHLPSYQGLLNRNKDIRHSQPHVRCLREVSIQLLEDILTDGENEEVAASIGSLEALFCLRQARSYALCDGFDTAVDYIVHYGNRASSTVLNYIHAFLQDVGRSADSAAQTDTQPHPMIGALQRVIQKMEEDLHNHPPSLRSIHRREKFRPLIVSSSKESFDGFMSGIRNSAEVLEAQDSDVAVCELRHVTCQKEGKDAMLEAETREKLIEFSHVFHVMDDRNRDTASSFLPPHLMQCIFAGRTHLLTVAVDESRELERIWNRNEKLYHKLGNVLKNVDSQKGEDCYMSIFPFVDVVSTLNTILADSEKIGRPTLNAPSDRALLNAPSERIQGDVPRRAQMSVPSRVNQGHNVLYLSVRDVCRRSVPELREYLGVSLKKAEEAGNNTLQVFVKVGRNQTSTPAMTYMFCAVAVDENLNRRVSVEVLL